MSALGAVADDDPARLERFITRTRDGRYTVHFQRYDAVKHRYVPHPITISPRFYERHGELVYAENVTPRELWPLIIEKAYAKWVGGYAGMDGGYAHELFELLYGATSHCIGVDALPPNKLFAHLRRLRRQHIPVVAQTRAPREAPMAAQHLLQSHAYVLRGVFERDGQRLVELHNPHGKTEPHGDGKNDGTFVIPFELFCQTFYWVSAVREAD